MGELTAEERATSAACCVHRTCGVAGHLEPLQQPAQLVGVPQLGIATEGGCVGALLLLGQLQVCGQVEAGRGHIAGHGLLEDAANLLRHLAAGRSRPPVSSGCPEASREQAPERVPARGPSRWAPGLCAGCPQAACNPASGACPRGPSSCGPTAGLPAGPHLTSSATGPERLRQRAQLQGPPSLFPKPAGIQRSPQTALCRPAALWLQGAPAELRASSELQEAMACPGLSKRPARHRLAPVHGADGPGRAARAARAGAGLAGGALGRARGQLWVRRADGAGWHRAAGRRGSGSPGGLRCGAGRSRPAASGAPHAPSRTRQQGAEAARPQQARTGPHARAQEGTPPLL